MSVPTASPSVIPFSLDQPITFQEFCLDPDNPEVIAAVIQQGVDISIWQQAAADVASGSIDIFQLCVADPVTAVVNAINNAQTADQLKTFGQFFFMMGVSQMTASGSNWWQNLFVMESLPAVKYVFMLALQFSYAVGVSVITVGKTAGQVAYTAATSNTFFRTGTEGAASAIAQTEEGGIQMMEMIKLKETVRAGLEAIGCDGAKLMTGGLSTLASLSKLNETAYAEFTNTLAEGALYFDNLVSIASGLEFSSIEAISTAKSLILGSRLFKGANSSAEFICSKMSQLVDSATLENLTSTTEYLSTWGKKLGGAMTEEIYKFAAARGLTSEALAAGKAYEGVSVLAPWMISTKSTMIGGEAGEALAQASLKSTEYMTSFGANIGVNLSEFGFESFSEGALIVGGGLTELGGLAMGGEAAPLFMACQIMGMIFQAMGVCTTTSGLDAAAFENYVNIFNELFKTNMINTYAITTDNSGNQSINPMYPIEVLATDYCFGITPDDSTWSKYEQILSNYYISSLSFNFSGFPICNITETYGAGAIQTPYAWSSVNNSLDNRQQKRALQTTNSNTVYANFVLKFWPFLLAIVLLTLSIIIFFIIKNE